MKTNQPLGLRLLAALSTVLGVIAAVIGGLFAVVAIQRNMLPYNSEGNYFDGYAVNYHEQSVLAYTLLATVSFLIALLFLGIRVLINRGRRRAEAPASS